ncbi:MAG: nicotinate-nicotinamide nucleotide adenylyltransferase, partial [Bacteroidota bacterium]
HLSMAKAALNNEVDEVWFIPSPLNPMKQSSDLLDFEIRFQMVELALNQFPKYKVLDIEKSLPKPSYTFQTIRFLKDRFSFRFSLLCGSDILNQFTQWKNYEEILMNAPLLVCERNNSCEIPRELKAFENRISFIPFQPSSISASGLRKTKSTTGIEAVDIFIRKNRLYGF